MWISELSIQDLKKKINWLFLEKLPKVCDQEIAVFFVLSLGKLW